MSCKEYHPCTMDCLNCKRPAAKCRGGPENATAVYANGTNPRYHTVSHGDAGAVPLIQRCKTTHRQR